MILQVPQSKYSNYYEVARFNLTWNFSIIMSIFLSILTIIFICLENTVAGPAFGGVLLSSTILIILKKTRTYKVSAILYSAFGTFLCVYALNFFPDSIHFVNPLWMLLIGLYTFFTMGKRWGVLVLAIALLGLIYYVIFNYKLNINSVSNASDNDLLALALNLVICITLNVFLILQFIKLNQIAAEESLKLTQELNEKNNEKTILLKEVHHRVKNNLQVIISLMRLKAIKENDSSSYSDTIDRIRSMSLIHEKIYQSTNLSKIDLKNYIESLAHDLISSYSLDTKIKLIIESNVESLKTKSLVPIALIFNELISNSIKHGFKNKKTGVISIYIDDRNHIVKMKYSDDGAWVENNSPDSLGLELIQSLTEQLTGSVDRQINNGTHYSFEFIYDE